MNYLKKMRKNHALDNIDGPILEHIINVFDKDPVSVEDLLEDYDFTPEQNKIILNTLFR